MNRKGIYLIWERLKSRKAEPKQRVQVKFSKLCWHVGHEYSIYLVSQTQNHVFSEFQRIKTFQTLHRDV